MSRNAAAAKLGAMAIDRRDTALRGQEGSTRVALMAARQKGMLTTHELRRCGLSYKAIAGRVRHGTLQPIYHGVYFFGHAAPPLDSLLLAAVKACGKDAVLSHYAAAAHLGLVRWDYRQPEVIVPAEARRGRPGIRVHRVALSPSDRTMHEGIRVTSVNRTICDLAAIVDARTLRRAVRQALALNLADLRSLLARRYSGRGAAQLREVLSAARPTRSELEDVVLDLLRSGGLEPPDVNEPLFIAGRKVVPDFRWPEQRVTVEADGRQWHDDPLARHDDAERQALLEARGEEVVRVTWRQAVKMPGRTLARASAALERAGRQVPPGPRPSSARPEPATAPA